MSGNDEPRPLGAGDAPLRLLDLTHRRRGTRAAPARDAEVCTIRVCPSVRSFYQRYAARTGISPEALLRLVLLGVMAVLDDGEV